MSQQSNIDCADCDHTFTTGELREAMVSGECPSCGACAIQPA